MFSRRPDGELVHELPLNRRAMPLLMRKRNESSFSFAYDVDLRKTDSFLDDFNAKNPSIEADVLHVALFALREVFVRYPSLNRFVAGGRIYQRHEITFTYVSRSSQLAGLWQLRKRRFDPAESFRALVAGVERFGAPGRAEQRQQAAVRAVMRAPGWVRRVAIGSVRVADAIGALPASYIAGDPFFATAYFADHSRTGIPSGIHHLHEHGTCGIVCVLGCPQPAATVGGAGGRVMRVSFSFDERIEDGFVSWLGLQHFRRVVEDPVAAGLSDAVAA